MSIKRTLWTPLTIGIFIVAAAALGSLPVVHSCGRTAGEPTVLVGPPLATIWGRPDASDASLVRTVDRWMSRYSYGNWFASDVGAVRPDLLLVTVPENPSTTTEPRLSRRVAVFVMENGSWRESAEFTVDGVPDFALASSTVLPTRSSDGAAAYRFDGNDAEELEVPSGIWRLSVSEHGQWVGVGPSGVHFGSIEENRLVSRIRTDVPSELLDHASSLGVAWLHHDQIVVLGSMYVVDVRAGGIRQISVPGDLALSVAPCRGCALDDRSVVGQDQRGVTFVVGVDAGGVVTSVHEFGLPVEQTLLEIDPNAEWAVTMTPDNPIIVTPARLQLFSISMGRVEAGQHRTLSGRRFFAIVRGGDAAQ